MKRNLLLALACVCLLAAGCAKSDENAMDTLKDPSGENSVSLGMAQTAVEQRLGTGTLLGQTAEGETLRAPRIKAGELAYYADAQQRNGAVYLYPVYVFTGEGTKRDGEQETFDVILDAKK